MSQLRKNEFLNYSQNYTLKGFIPDPSYVHAHVYAYAHVYAHVHPKDGHPCLPMDGHPCPPMDGHTCLPMNDHPSLPNPSWEANLT